MTDPLRSALQCLVDQIEDRMVKRDRWELGDCDFADAYDRAVAALSSTEIEGGERLEQAVRSALKSTGPFAQATVYADGRCAIYRSTLAEVLGPLLSPSPSPEPRQRVEEQIRLTHRGIDEANRLLKSLEPAPRQGEPGEEEP